VGGKDAEGLAAGGFAGLDAGGAVFDDQALGGFEAEAEGSVEVGLGVGLAVSDVICGDDGGGDGKADVAETVFHQALGG
jgi:hypothetical protein